MAYSFPSNFATCAASTASTCSTKLLHEYLVATTARSSTTLPRTETSHLREQIALDEGIPVFAELPVVLAGGPSWGAQGGGTCSPAAQAQTIVPVGDNSAQHIANQVGRLLFRRFLANDGGNLTHGKVG